MRRGLIGTISNYKGGTGKTITAVNLSAALAIKKKKVLLIDNDPQSDSTRSLVKGPAIIRSCMYDLLNVDEEDKIPVEDCIYPTIQDNLDIIPNIPETSGHEIPLAQDFPGSNATLKKAVYEYAVSNYDYIFIDCPPTLSVFVANALFCSDVVIIPMTAGSGNSLEGIKGVMDLMLSMKEQNNNLKEFKILINKIDRRKSAHKANISNAQMRFGEENIFNSTIPTSSDFETVEAIKQTTIFNYATRSKGANAFRNLAKEFLNLFENRN